MLSNVTIEIKLIQGVALFYRIYFLITKTMSFFVEPQRVIHRKVKDNKIKTGSATGSDY